MSQFKRVNLGLLVVMIMTAFFVFGCNKSTPVNDIAFSLDGCEQIVLMVGQEFDLTDHVEIQPSYATNRNYSITSFDDAVVRVENKKLIAIAEGNTQIRVVSEDNSLKEDLMSVVVKKTKTTLNAPLNLRYDNVSRSFSFDSVTYASSYTIKINGTDYNLGNSTTFNMNQYAGKFEDGLVVAQVKANAPSYSFALESSGFSGEYKMYQAGALKNVQVESGVLSFEKSSSSIAVYVYINNTLFENKEHGNTVSLKTLPDSYAGTEIKVDVEAVVGDEIRSQLDGDVNYFNAIKQSVNVNVLNIAEIQYASNSISWASVPYSNGYAIYIDGEEMLTTNDNHCNLTQLTDYETIFNDGVAHTIKVEPLIGSDSVNVGKTVAESLINVKRLESTEVGCDGEYIKWSDVDFASYYVVTLVDGENVTTTSMADTSINMADYSSGKYKILIEAFPGVLNGDIAYLSSEVVEFEFDKQDAVSAEIDNYVLTIIDENNDSYKIDFDVDEYDQPLVVANGGSASINLINYDFPAGQHAITITRLGNSNHIQSNSLTLQFTQLEAIENIEIQNGVAQIVRSSINADAEFKLVTTGTGFDMEVVGESVEFNTTDSSVDTFMENGDYEVSVFVVGDGKETFSYRVNGETVASKTVEFKVLPATQLSLNSSAEEKLSITEVTDADSYKIFKYDGETVSELANVSELECEFELESGEMRFSVQTIGDGSTCLNSIVSDFIVVTRLATPKLVFNSETNKLSVVENNDASIIEGQTIVKNGTEIIEDISQPFNLTEDTEFVLTIIASVGSDGEFYLNSQPYTLELTKITSASKIELDENNNLIIEADGHDKAYNMILKFNLGGEVYEFKTAENGLTDGTTTLDFVYEDNKYVITIVENFNTIIEEMGDNFSVEVQFVEPSDGDDVLINSEKVSENLSLIHIDNNSTISTNEENQIVITAPNLGKECGLVVVLSNNDDSFRFVSEVNGSERNLVLGATKLPYIYDENSSVYYINTIDSNFNFLHEVFEHDFNIEIQYTHLLNSATLTDLDSAITNKVQIYVQSVSEISREENTQNLVFTKANETDIFEDYSFLITDVESKEYFTFNLTEEMVVTNDGSFTVNVSKFYDAIIAKGWSDSKVYLINVITLNDNTDPARTPNLAKKGGELYIQKSPTVELYTTKDNNNKDNNSVVINFEILEDLLFNKIYIVELYNEGGSNKTVQTRDDDDATNEIVSISVDEFKMLGTIYAKAYIQTTSNYVDSKTIEVFNSNYSNELTLVPVDTVTNLSVKGSSICFNSVESAVGYEVYSVYQGVYTKLNESLLTTTEFEIKTTGLTEIVVKTIAEVGYSNSCYSESIKVNKPKQPKITVENGKFVVDFITSLDVAMLIVSNKDKVIPEIINDQGEKKTINLDETKDDITIIANIFPPQAKIIMEPSLFLSYNTAKVSKETLKVSISFAEGFALDDVYYLDIDPINVDSYGLFEPLNLTKATDGDTKVESISWKYNSKNYLMKDSVPVDLKNNVGYVLKIKHTLGGTTKTYYSDDTTTQLRYFDVESGLYKPYDKIISGTSAIFPAGCSDSENYLDVKFDSGIFEVFVKTVPLSDVEIPGINLCNSKYSEPCVFNMLNKISLTMSDGNVAWEEQDGAGSYEISIIKDGEVEPIKEVITTTYYDFSTKPTLTHGIYTVTVKAIGKNISVLNSVPSEPMMVYKLPEAKALTIDDGNIIIESNGYFSKIKLEFIDKTTGIVYEQIHDNSEFAALHLEALGVKSWETFTEDSRIYNDSVLTPFEPDDNILNIIAGNNYEINVTLIGNSTTITPFVNSTKTVSISNVLAAKLKANLNQISLGTIQFKPNSEYVTITKLGEDNYLYENHVDINYVFNGDAKTSSEFWKKTAVYKIDIVCPGTKHTIYAVDYFCYNSVGVDEGDFEKLDNQGNLIGLIRYKHENGEIYFNLFKDNILNLKDYNTLTYAIVVNAMQNGASRFEGNGESFGSIDLDTVGSIAVTVSMIGGDSYEKDEKTIGYLNSSENETETFIRYAINQISTHEGKVSFNDIKAVRVSDNGDGTENVTIIDYPIYQVVATPADPEEHVKTFYLYYNIDESSLTNAKNVITKLLGTTPDDKWFIELETAEDVENLLLFNLSEHISSGNHYVTIRTIAGAAAEGEFANYLLNSKISDSYPVQKLCDVAFAKADGLLKFNQAYVTDGRNYVYSEDYEITISDGTNEYSFEIDGGDISIDNSGVTPIVKYELPAQIKIEGEDNPIVIEAITEYQIKIKALSKVNPVLNGTYKKLSGTTDDETLTISKYQSVEDVDIENGVLVWTHPTNAEKLSVRIKFTDEEQRNIYIRKTEIPCVNGKYTYQIEDSEFDFSPEGIGKSQILSGINYSISIQVIGDEETLNSSYSAIIPAERLARVDYSTIRTENGFLTWDSVENAVAYEVNIKGVGSEIVSTNHFDHLNLNLAAGTYSINIRAIGDDDITSLPSEESVDIVQLATVDISTIKFEGNNITWAEVEGADKYRVVFNHSDGLIDDLFEENCFTAPEGMSGEFEITIMAISVETGKELNSKLSDTYIGKIARPSPVENGTQYNPETRTIEIYVNSEDFYQGDKILIQANMYLYTDGECNQDQDSAVPFEVEVDWENASKSVYSVALKTIAVYEDVRISVVRQGTMASDVKVIDDINFNLFNHGDGDEKPYAIASADQLFNIKYFLNSKFEIKNEITIDVSKIESYDGIITNKEFTGEIIGNKNFLKFSGDIQLTDTTNFSLFKNFNGKISNLKIGSDLYNTYITNTLTDNFNKNVTIAIFAETTNNAEITDVYVNNCYVKIQSSDYTYKFSNKLNIAGLIYDMNNTSLTSKSSTLADLAAINLNVEINTALSSTSGVEVNVAGIAVRSNGSNIINYKTTFNISTSGEQILTRVAGAVAEFNGEAYKYAEITNVNSNFTANGVKSSWVGGLIAQAEYAKIQSCETRGQYSDLGIGNSTYIAGIVGQATKVDIINSGSFIEFTIKLNNTSDKYIGAIVGYIEGTAQTLSKIIDCYSDCYNKDNLDTYVQTSNQLTVCMYGKCYANTVEMSGWSNNKKE